MMADLTELLERRGRGNLMELLKEPEVEPTPEPVAEKGFLARLVEDVREHPPPIIFDPKMAGVSVEELPPDTRFGYPGYPFGLREPVEQTITEWAAIPTEWPEGVKDFLLRVVPTSAAKTTVGITKFFLSDLPRSIAEPFVISFQANYEKEKMKAVREDLGLGEVPTPGQVDLVDEALARTIHENAEGLARFMGGEQVGLFGWEDFKRRWATDPVGAIVGILGARHVGSRLKMRAVESSKVAVPPLERGDVGIVEMPEYTINRQVREGVQRLKEEVIQARPSVLGEFKRTTTVEMVDAKGERRPLATGEELTGGEKAMIDVEPGVPEIVEGRQYTPVEELGEVRFHRSPDGTVYKNKFGVPWKTRAATNVTREAILRQDGVETVPTQLGKDGPWVLMEKEGVVRAGDAATDWTEFDSWVEERKGEEVPVVEEPRLAPEEKERRVIDDIDETISDAIGERVPPTLEEHPFYDDAKSTQEKATIYSDPDTLKRVESDIESYVVYLMNRANQWKHGLAELDIDALRNDLSQIASNADTFRRAFEDPNDHAQFKALSEEAATYVRNLRTGPEVPPSEVKLYSGLPVDKLYDKIDAAKKVPFMQSLKEHGHGLKKYGLDVGARVRNELFRMAMKGDHVAYEAAQHFALARGASSRGARMYKQSEREVYRGLSREDKRLVDRGIMSRRVMQLDAKDYPRRGFQFMEGLGREEHSRYWDTLPQDVKTRVDSYFDVMRDQLKQLRDEGVITQELYSELKDFDYSRFKLIDKIDPVYSYEKSGGQKVSVRESGIQYLKRGKREELLETDSRLLLADVISRTQARIMHNRANRALLEVAETVTDNPVVKTWKADKRAPAGWRTVNVMVDGKKQAMIMPEVYADSWVLHQHEISQRAANFMRVISGSFLLRPMATGINVGFAFANLPRDIMHIWLTSDIMVDGKWESTYSGHLPVAALQMARDIAVVLPDAVLRRGRWDGYLKRGGGMDFLVHQGKAFKRDTPTSRAADSIYEVLGYVGETSEIVTRLALEERALRRGAKPEEATWVARSYLDFGQGGSIAKMADTSIPYLNAAIQGTRGVFRTAERNPRTFGWKVTQIGALATGLYLANQYSNPGVLETIPEAVRNRYWIMTTPWKVEDNYGVERPFYFKIAKDQGQQFFAAAFEAGVDKWQGKEINVDRLVETLGELSPVDMTGIFPPTAEALGGYLLNKNFWTREDVWKLEKPAEAQEEYYSTTHPAFRKLGEVTGASPERMKYALSRLFTSGNLYTYGVGQGWKNVFGHLPHEQQETAFLLSLARAPISGRVMGLGNPYVEYAEDLEDARQEDDMRRLIQNRELDVRAEEFFAKRMERKDIREFIKGVEKESDQERLVDRFQNYVKVRSLPGEDRRWWVNFATLSPEARAKVFHQRWSEADADEKQRIRQGANLMKGLFSKKTEGGKRFWRELGQQKLE